MKWQLSDGTVVHLGGQIDGDSDVAQRFRSAVELIVSGLEPFDLGDSARMHTWVYACAERAGVKVVDSPYHFEVSFSRERGEHTVIKSPDPRAKLLPAEKEFVRYLVQLAIQSSELKQRSKPKQE